MNKWIRYIAHNIRVKSLSRLYSVTYLAYAYYIPTFGSGEIFKATFKAGRFGIIMPNITDDIFEDDFQINRDELIAQEIRVLIYLDLIIEMSNEVNDIGLILRVMEDDVWADNLDKVIDNKDIVKEYRDK